jgi:hypothetical protein
MLHVLWGEKKRRAEAGGRSRREPIPEQPGSISRKGENMDDQAGNARQVCLLASSPGWHRTKTSSCLLGTKSGK